MSRKSGVLLHVSSLPGEYSTGSFGKEAKNFIDFLSSSGFSFWQVLPFCMIDDCNSPYKSYCSFGANPYFIDLEILHERGLITIDELLDSRQKSPYLCEFDRLRKERIPLLFKASERCDESEIAKVAEFIAKHDELAIAAKFLALKEENENLPWQEWKTEKPNEKKLFAWQFIQYEFFRQWTEIKTYANEKGISIIGDVPIYVATDSADVWAHPELFDLGKDNYPRSVAGVPPDYFSEDGQLWRNPLYNWKRMKQDGFAWWKKRIEHMLTLFDGIRIDHFRAFESYWSVPRDAKSAKEGKWVKGPGRALIDAIKETANGKLIIAEDLGDITPAVYSLLKYSSFPGMRVLQFAFLGDDKTPHLPHNYDKNCVAYSGTHDNNTLLGYIWESDDATRRRIFDYFGYRGYDFSDAARHIVERMLSSTADTVIFPIQDLLVYGADTRMNTPGIAENNWAYRVTKDQLNSINKEDFRYKNLLFSRI